MYSLISIIALVVTAVIDSNLLLNPHYVPRDKKLFRGYRFLFYSAWLYFLFDLLWGFLDTVEPRIYVEIDTALYFMAMGLFLFAWFNFIARYLQAKKYSRIGLITLSSIFFAGGVILSIINFFTPVLFSYEGNAYAGNMGRNIYLITQIAIFGIAALYAAIVIIVRQSEKTRQYVAIVIASLVMMGMVFAQYFNPLFPFYGVGCFLLLVFVHTFIALAEREAFQSSIDTGLKREKETAKKLDIIRKIAYTDPLTGVKSKHSYVEFEQRIDEDIRNKKIDEFSLLLFDLNDLKKINDRYGHETGDKYIVKSVQIIQKYTDSAPIYRYGGDEFVVFLAGESYQKRFQMLDDFNSYIDSCVGTDEPIIAAGFSDFIPGEDNTLGAVFARADETMYHRKRYLKGFSAPVNNEEGEDNIDASIDTRMSIYEMFYYSNKMTLIGMLNSSNADEMIEADFNKDSYKQIYHVVGKYFVPEIDDKLSSLIDFTAKHIVHPDDVGEYLNLMKLDGFFERLKNARIPNFSYAHLRYKLQGGEYRYVEQCVITGKENGFEEGKCRIFVFDINNMMRRKLGGVGDDSNVISIGRDEVTGLLTGKEFLKNVQEKVKIDVDFPWSIISIDIEHFRIFSEWFGRDRSRVLLTSLGVELLEAEKDYGGIGGYFGQDDFFFLIPLDEEMINGLYDRLYKVIKSFDLTGGLLPAFGVAEVEPGLEIMDVLDRATIASTKAKGDIDKRICYYSLDMEYAVEQEYRILSSFANALENDEITFYLQPQCRISTGAIVGAEALARWIKKDGTIASPAEFVPVLEKYRFITDLDKYMWEKVCAYIGERVNNKKNIVPISINVSRIDIYNLDLSEYLIELCDKYHVPHKYLKIEITESAYATATEKIEQLVDKLRSSGFLVMMDDFGSGYSSLNMLSNLKLDVIKMDAKFLHFGEEGFDKGIHILESVVNLAKVMALPIVVEGVETAEQTEFLAGLGCRYAQGYYFYHPLSIEKFNSIIDNNKMVDHRGIIVKINEQFRIREFLDKNIYSDSMLNNIIGAVAIYSLDGKHLDIIRYNEQFYKTVNVPDFVDRLVNIEQFVPEEDRPGLFKALAESKANKLVGASANVRFRLTNGNLSFYDIHFYYLGKKEGTDQFYGSAHNVSELLNAVEEKKLISEYSSDNIIFVKKEYDKWLYSVASHGLANIFGLTSQELEIELNNGAFARRITNKKELRQLMNEGKTHADNKEDFVKSLYAYDKDGNKINLNLTFKYVGDKASNIVYILSSSITK